VRVGLVCPYSLTTPGGVQFQVLGLARALRVLGCEVQVLGPCDGPAPAGVTAVGRSYAFRVNGSIARMTLDPAAALRTIRALRQARVDVIHLHEPLAPSITIPVLLARPSPLVATFHAAGDRTPYRRLSGPARLLAQRIDVRVAVSDAARSLAHRYLGGSYEVVFNGIDIADETANPDARARSTVLFLGRHEPRKGLEVLLESLSDLPDVDLWVAGDGSATARLRARHASNPRITWLGTLSETEKAARLRAASVLCVPSLHGESFGVVLLEAMAAGTPVVASDLASYRAVARDGYEAILVPPGDAHAFARALRRALDEPATADRLRTLGKLRSQMFGMPDLAQRYLTIYEQQRIRHR
jgi:phosphatidylinositol alpha-mannosyltransferase